MCKMCGERGETVQHLICECKILAQREYKRIHDTVAKLVLWKLCEKHNLERKWKSKTRVTSYELRVQIHELEI